MRWSGVELRRCPAVAIALTLACAKPADLESKAERYAEQLTAAREAICTCPTELGYADKEECRTIFPPVSDVECILDALGPEGPDRAARYLDCDGAAHDDLAHCLSLNEMCNQDGISLCGNTFADDRELCPQLSLTAEVDLDQCAD